MQLLHRPTMHRCKCGTWEAEVQASFPCLRQDSGVVDWVVRSARRKRGERTSEVSGKRGERPDGAEVIGPKCSTSRYQTDGRSFRMGGNLQLSGESSNVRCTVSVQSAAQP